MILDMFNLEYADELARQRQAEIRQEVDNERQLRACARNSERSEKLAARLLLRLRGVWLSISSGLEALASH